MLGKKFRILVVDDEVEIAKTITNYLALEGYESVYTTRATDVMDILIKNSFQMVISDISMPDMNGIDLLRKIKQYDGMTQVVMITGYVSMNNILSAFRIGANNVFFKPLENLDLLKQEIKYAEDKFVRIQSALKTRNELAKYS